MYKSFINNPIGKKIIMAVTGLLLCLFLIGHLIGNLLLYVGKEAFNTYSDALTSTSMIYIVEFGLLAILVIHIWSAIVVSLDNKRARNIDYKIKKTAGKSTIFSRYMLHTGVIIMLFVIMHVISFKFGPWDNQLVKYSITLYDHVVISFSAIYVVIPYVLCMIVLGFHLHHAIKSALITLGLGRSSRLAIYNLISFLFAVIIAAGFSSFPIYFYLSSL